MDRTDLKSDTELTQPRSRRVRVTLNGIKRVGGFTEWKGFRRWQRRKVFIWSREHGAFWRPDAAGYTDDPAQAWVVDFPQAYMRTAHCGPEKRIEYIAVP